MNQKPEEILEFDNEQDWHTIEEVVEYLNTEYVEPLNQGPILVTGSSVYGKNPNDYDLVVNRQAEDKREFRRGRRKPTPRSNAVPADQDYRVMASMMKDLSNDEEFENYDSNQAMRQTKFLFFNSENARADEIGYDHNPENRFQVEIQDIDFDIVFTPTKPNREHYRLR